MYDYFFQSNGQHNDNPSKETSTNDIAAILEYVLAAITLLVIIELLIICLDILNSGDVVMRRKAPNYHKYLTFIIYLDSLYIAENLNSMYVCVCAWCVWVFVIL